MRMTIMKSVTIYTDGACLGNPGPGGWCCILSYQNNFKKLSGGTEETTNNRMELQAIIEGLKALKENCEVKIISDSQYSINPFNKNWLQKWQLSNWKLSNGQPVKNRDLWEILIEESKKHKISFEYIKGHSGHKYNEECDSEARKQAGIFTKK